MSKIAILIVLGIGLVLLAGLGCSNDQPAEPILAPYQPSGSSAETRPIQEFVDAQGTWCLPDGVGGCLLFVPPLENFLGFSDPADGLSMSVDYAGIADRWIVAESGGAVSFGTTFSGGITERPLADGRAEVQVILRTRNALTWVVDGFDFNGPLAFGWRAPDVLYDGRIPALGSSVMKFTFINTGPGAPMPDLMQLVFEPLPGQELVSVIYNGRADGELHAASGYPEGTAGHAGTHQTGLFMSGFHGAVGDGFPAENVWLAPALDGGAEGGMLEENR